MTVVFHDGRCRKLNIGADVFFPTGQRVGLSKTGMSVEEAEDDVEKRICALCPRQMDCVEYAIEHGITDGVWGFASKKRARVRRNKSLRIKIAV